MITKYANPALEEQFMTHEEKEKLQYKLRLQKGKERELKHTNNVLLQECLQALSTYRIISDSIEEDEISQKINSMVKAFTVFCKEIPQLSSNERYYIFWDNFDTPIIECAGQNILDHFDDMTAVAFKTIFYSKSADTVFLYQP